MKILIIEDQAELIKNKLDAINLLEFDSKLEFIYAPTSQEAGKVHSFIKYAVIIIDIDLSVNSKKDGIGIITDISNYNKDFLKKVIVLTGSSLVKDSLDNKGFNDIPVLKKPMDMTEVSSAIQQIINNN
ncbi:hypothetical protein KJ942_00950 [bacterium]|nr:hypothetical protein [bacterium]